VANHKIQRFEKTGFRDFQTPRAYVLHFVPVLLQNGF